MNIRTIAMGKKGTVIFITIFGLIFIFGLLALVIDVGWMYFFYNKLQISVDSSWKAGFDEMTRLMSLSGKPLNDQQKDLVRRRVKDVFFANGHSASDTERVSIVFSQAKEGGASNVDVSADLTLNLFFARILEFPVARVFASRHKLGKGSQNELFIFPIAIPHGEIKEKPGQPPSVILFKNPEEFQSGKLYPLWLPDPKVSGFLNFDGAQAKGIFPLRLLNGYMKPVPVNFRVSRNVEGQQEEFERILKQRFFEFPESRKIIAAIADIPPETRNQVSSLTNESSFFDLDQNQDQVRIIGFAEFELENPFASLASSPLSLEGAQMQGLKGTFLRYVVHPREVSDQLN